MFAPRRCARVTGAQWRIYKGFERLSRFVVFRFTGRPMFPILFPTVFPETDLRAPIENLSKMSRIITAFRDNYGV